MIHFFRRIRQGLINRDRIGKYLLYAIGEVLLVVIGILIALQFNNWNESSKKRGYELKMLREVKLALEQDIKNLEGLTKRIERADSAAIAFIDLAHKGYDVRDSLKIIATYDKSWWRLRTGIEYRANFGPYEAIKSSGIDNISNDSLRNQLIHFYDFDLPSLLFRVNWYDRDFEKYLEMQNAFREEIVIQKNEGEFKITRQIPGDLYKRQEWISLIDDIHNRLRWSKQRVQEIIPEMDKMAQKISIELGDYRPNLPTP
ncbi:DUF6090 family protein [Flavobacteriaceae sp. LMIT009]